MAKLQIGIKQLCVWIMLAFGHQVFAAPVEPSDAANDLAVDVTADVRVESFVWTDAVDRHTRQFQGKLVQPVRGKKAFLWMQLQGSAALLKQLQNSTKGSMPIRHEWYKYQSDAIEAESPDMLDLAVDLSVGKKESLQKLAFEVDATGAFRWRVWSGKQQLTPGYWRVDLVYSSGVPVICPTPENKLKPCKFVIEVKR
jgi:hypothetical protein